MRGSKVPSQSRLHKNARWACGSSTYTVYFRVTESGPLSEAAQAALMKRLTAFELLSITTSKAATRPMPKLANKSVFLEHPWISWGVMLWDPRCWAPNEDRVYILCVWGYKPERHGCNWAWSIPVSWHEHLSGGIVIGWTFCRLLCHLFVCGHLIFPCQRSPWSQRPHRGLQTSFTTALSQHTRCVSSPRSNLTLPGHGSVNYSDPRGDKPAGSLRLSNVSICG